MTTLSRVILFLGIVTLKNFTVSSENVKTPNIVTSRTFHSDDGMVGIASVAAITSKDGKVSTTGGVQFIPSKTGTKQSKSANFMQPWIFSRKSSDGFAMGSLQIFPNAVVTATTSYGNPKNNFEQINPPMDWPAPTNFLPQSLSTNTRQNPNTPYYMFKDFDPLIPDFSIPWIRTNYDPFLDIWH